ncbi:MAG: hypothetical protein CMK38_00065 [Porticoccaceae bacterium]|nr:hypothetical protein [Porticoccaceae bacterium]
MLEKMTSLSKLELYNPKTKETEAFRLGYKTNHRTTVNKCSEDELKRTLTECFDNLNTNSPRWCEMEILHPSGVWLQRALKSDENSEGKEVVLAMREGKALHSNSARREAFIKEYGLQDIQWCKIAIRDTIKNTILFRTIKNYTDEFLETQGVAREFPTKELESQVSRWTIYGSQKTQKPSSFSADMIFWKHLHRILFSQ